MSPRVQRLLIILLIVYYTLLGGTYYTERAAALRLFHQVATGLLFATWLVSLWRSGRNFPATPLDKPLVVYGLLWFLAAVFAPLDRRVSLEYTWPILTQFLGFYLLVDLMRRGRQRWIMEGLFTACAVVVLLSGIEFVSWYLGLPLSPTFSQSWPQIGGWSIPPMVYKISLAMNVSTLLGNFTATMIPLTAAWAMTARQRDLRIGLWLLAGGLAVTLLLSGSRSAFMALVTSAGVLTLTWLLRPEVRQRFPAFLRPLLAPRLLLIIATVGGLIFVSGVLLITLRNEMSGSDLNRIDLWRSALLMARDHPLLGVGPYQYGLALRQYGTPELFVHQNRLVAAHNLALHTLAEGGVLTTAAGLWLAGAFALLWWREWRFASPGRRRRLEGGLAALAGFAVQSLVDTFTLTPLLVPILIFAAYTVAGSITRAEAVRTPQLIASGSRRPIGVLLIVLAVAQIALLPVHAGNLAHDRALRALANSDLEGALEATRAAHAADPALSLYPLHEAYILGRLAAEDPQTYLSQAIAAHEAGQQMSPTWDIGWNNLAALYAQAGRYEDAAAAAERAAALYPAQAGYHLRLGSYYEELGQWEKAHAEYLTALWRNHNLGSSGFWTDPAHPARRAVLEDAIALYAADGDIGLRLALEAGDIDAATAIARTIDPDTATHLVLRDLGDWAMAVNDEAIAPCPECYFIEVVNRGSPYLWVDYVRLAELALRNPEVSERMGMSAEQMARVGLFLDPVMSGRSWYVLARLAEQAGADDETINNLLIRSVPPLLSRQEFSSAVYGRIAAFDNLPQARFPVLYRSEYAPWLWLAERFEESGQYDRARRVYEVLLDGDPYLWDIRQRMEALPG